MVRKAFINICVLGLTVLCLAEAPRKFPGVAQLADFSKRVHAQLLLYFNNANDIDVVIDGEHLPLNLETRLFSSTAACCPHHATPALSHSGDRLAYVRLVSANPRREAISIYEFATKEQKDVFETEVIWGISWSPDDARLAVVADQKKADSHDLFVVDLPSANATQLTRGTVELDGAEYIASVYAPPSWNSAGTRLAVEFRREGLGGGNSDSSVIVLWELANNQFSKLADGVQPSWSPVGETLAFYDRSRKECFTLSPQDGQKKLLFSLKKIRASGSTPLFYPVVWSPDAKEILFHQWVDADLVTDIYRFNLASRKLQRISRSEMQVVSWQRRR